MHTLASGSQGWRSLVLVLSASRMVTWLVPLCLVCGSSQLHSRYRSSIPTKSPASNRWKPEKACEDMYMRYCQTLTPDKCYLAYNRKLCCKTCTTYNQLYSASTEEDACAYGDRKRSECTEMPTNLCYNIYNRYMCCRKCASVRTHMPHCRYGDKDVHECSKIKPHYCYKKDVEKKCCGTCAKFFTGRNGCEYGDRVMLFQRSRKKYNCAAYTAHFGHARCKMPWETKFQATCCGSCHDAFHGKQRYNYYG